MHYIKLFEEYSYLIAIDKKIARSKKFIADAKKKHTNKYDYSKVNYINAHTPVKIKCPIHGYFLQTPTSHLFGNGCRECGGKLKLTTKDFIKKSKEIHGNKYDYSQAKYINAHTPIKIYCPVHKQFFYQRPTNHLQGRGCQKCVGDTLRGVFALSKEDFIKKSKDLHGNKYDYSDVDYFNSQTKVSITCPIHGSFSQVPNSHLSGNGCPICNESKGEKTTSDVLNSLKINHLRQHKFSNCIGVTGRRLPFDFYLPDYNMCIEYHGEQHYKAFNYFGGEEKFKTTQRNDKIKEKYCQLYDIELIIIPYTINGFNNIHDFLIKYGFK